MKGGGIARAFMAAAALSFGAFAPGGLGVGMTGAPIVAPAGKHVDKRQKTRRPDPSDVATYLRRTGWTNARHQRASRKRRNQLKNRSAHRG